MKLIMIQKIKMTKISNCKWKLIYDTKLDKCKWEHYHDCIKQLKVSGEYQGLKYLDNVDSVEDTFLSTTRGQKEITYIRKTVDIYDDAKEKLCKFRIALYTVLAENTYWKKTKSLLNEHTWNLIDFLTFHKRLKRLVWLVGSTFTANLPEVCQKTTSKICYSDWWLWN